MTRLGAAPWGRTPRTMRLEKDHREMLQLRKDSTIVDFTVDDNDPPERYRITFRGKSLVPKGGGYVIGDRQEVEVRLGVNYPIGRPEVYWKTSVGHPNISGGNVCFGNFGTYWTPNFRLTELVEVLWDYARLAILNPYHSYEGQGAPKKWADLDKRFGFPVDKRPLRDLIKGPDEGSSVVRAEPSDRDDILIIDDDEGTCG